MYDARSQSARSLEGPWALALDPQDVGIAEGWWRSHSYSHNVDLPGSLPSQSIGDRPTAIKWTASLFDLDWATQPKWAPYGKADDLKLPFFLLPTHQYVGAAWYRRDIEIPQAWSGRRVVLKLERVHWGSRVWIDDREFGSNDSLCVPHVYDLGADLAPGQHTLTVRVDNRLIVNVGLNAHSVSDHTQGNWNGIIGRIELSSTSAVWLDEVTVHGNVARRSARLQIAIGNATGKPGRGTLRVGDTTEPVEWTSAGARTEIEVRLGDSAPFWDEFQPALHQLEIELTGENADDRKTVRFGLREFSTEGTQFTINGRRTFLRGTLECCIFPRTGYPPTDVESWKKIFQICRDHGLNHVRFHSWCPPEAAFEAADELGVYIQVEVATWPNAVPVEAGASPSGIGDGDAVDTWVYAETTRILREYGNHPCFVLMAVGNEPGGPNQVAYLNAWVAHFRGVDSRRLYTGTAGWPELAENQFHVIPEPRGHQWLDGLRSRLNRDAPSTTMDYRESIAKRSVPLVSHEIGQWCSYPPLKDAAKYTGHLKARNYEIFAETLAANGMEGQLDAFVQASGKLQALCYREEIESALRTPGMGGFQLLDLHDFPGQGTAPVGVLDAFWESKGYITADEFRRFCAPTVLLARLPKRVFTSGETLRAKIDVAHFGPAEMEGAVVSWRVVGEDGTVMGTGAFPPTRIPLGSGIPLGEVSVALVADSAPARVRLEVELDQTPIANDWDIWIYPQTISDATATDVTVFQSWNAEAREVLGQGGKVLLMRPARSLDKPAAVELGFTPIFWNTYCTKRQAPHTLGILCDPRHPALAAFPTASHTDWHWWYLLHRASPMILDDLPRGLRPIVQVIDDWYTNRRLGLVVEAKVGRGGLLLCGMDLSAGDDPVSRQFLASLLRYMGSSAFQPSIEISGSQLDSLITAP